MTLPNFAQGLSYTIVAMKYSSTARMRFLLLAASLQISLLGRSSLAACTLWGIEGQPVDGGTLMAKNRDWAPDQIQKLSVVRPIAGSGLHAYFGLFAASDDDPEDKLELKAGVNDAGLCVVTASADSIPRSHRARQTGKSAVAARVLARYSSVAEIEAGAERLFSNARAVFLMIADKKELLAVEIGLDGKWSIVHPHNGVACHTNHFLSASMQDFNSSTGKSSRARLSRIDELLALRLQDPSTVTAADFQAMSKDVQGGPDDSIWRTGREWTLASWIIRIPDAGDPTVEVEWLPAIASGLASARQDWQETKLVLDKDFWDSDPRSP